MSDLTQKTCKACEGGVAPLTLDEISALLENVPGWEVREKSLVREYSFAHFDETMAFVNAVAWVARCENHHPDMEVGFNYCTVRYTTHAVDALTENDFICAAKINALTAN